MVPQSVSEGVSDLLARLDEDPTAFPLAELVALHGAGHDVEITRGERGAVAVVSPRPGASLPAELTRREREVAMLAAGGFSNQQIASTLCVSLATVKDHMHAILRKSGLESRTQLVAAWYGGLAEH